MLACVYTCIYVGGWLGSLVGIITAFAKTLDLKIARLDNWQDFKDCRLLYKYPIVKERGGNYSSLQHCGSVDRNYCYI